MDGTCLWFLEHRHFKDHWIHQESGLLLVTADPGCGKSVLSKHLIDHVLPDQLSKPGESATICYFFFNKPMQTKLNEALCALLHQLLSQKLFLIRRVQDECNREGEALRNNTTKLWALFQALLAEDDTGPVRFVIDALDECAEDDYKMLAKYLNHLFKTALVKVKMLLTSRPYSEITSTFSKFALRDLASRVKGENESTRISSEIAKVIPHRVRHLEYMRGMEPGSLEFLEKRLLAIEHWTYRWLRMDFDYLESSELTDRTFDQLSSISLFWSGISVRKGIIHPSSRGKS